jgi:hypothetical protein
MMEMPGTEEMLSAGQAQTIGRRLKSLSGAVSAMQDIFGDRGRKGTMEEIIQGLESLTQGGLSSMTPGQLEEVVRTTRNLAKTSGLGIQGMLGLNAQNANMADQLGLDRSLALGATQQTAAWAIAARRTQGLDQPAFGRLTVEEQALLNNQLQMGGMASQTGNILGASVRMQQEGLVTAGSDADLLAQAITTGQTEWTDSGGKRRSVAMSNAEWVQIMEGSGVTRGTAESILSDRFLSQEYIRDFGLNGLSRQLQREVDIVPRVASTFSNALGTQLSQQGVGAVLRDRLNMTEGQINELTVAASTQAASQMFDLDQATVNDNVKFNEAIGRLTTEAISEQVLAAGGTSADVAAVVASIDQRETGAAMRAQLNTRIRVDRGMSRYRGSRGLWQMQNLETLTNQGAQIAEAQTTGRMQSAMARVGRFGPIGRTIAEMQGDPENRSFSDILAKVMGFVSDEDLKGTALGGVSTAIREFQQVERHTDETALQAEMDREIAQGEGITLADYRDRIRRATGDDRTRMIAERDQRRAGLSADQDFIERTSGAVRARIGTPTARGVRQQSLAAAMTSGLAEGGQKAELARQMLAIHIGGEGTEIGDMKANWWKTKIAAAATPDERQRLESLQQINDVLQGAQEGRTTDVQLKAMGFTEEEIPTAGPGKPVERAAAKDGERMGSVDIGRAVDQFVDALKKTSEQFREVQRPTTADRQDKKLVAKVSGTLDLKGNTGDLSGDITIGGDHEHNDVLTDAIGYLTSGPGFAS